MVGRETDGLTVMRTHNDSAYLALIITKCLLPCQMQAKSQFCHILDQQLIQHSSEL